MNCECGREVNLSADPRGGNHQKTLCPCGTKWQWHAKGQHFTDQGALRYGSGPCPGLGACDDYDPDAKTVTF